MRNNVQKVWILKGLPASGKSTWAMEYIKEHQDTKRVNRDDIRRMTNGYVLNDKNEKMVTNIERSLIASILFDGYNLIIDNTHLNPKTEKANIEYVKSIAIKNDIPTLDIEVKFFEVSLAEAIERDKKRQNPVGEKVIKRMYRDYLYKEEYVEFQNDPALPWCIVVDVDGTLSFNHNRSPFDFKKVKEDWPKWDVIHLLYTLQSRVDNTFVMSGRDDSCYDDTALWLDYTAKVNYTDLYMRATGDKRKDSIVKRELYEKHIKGKYNVLCWIDDRKQVVDMVRNELKLLCLDVSGHDV